MDQIILALMGMGLLSLILVAVLYYYLRLHRRRRRPPVSPTPQREPTPSPLPAAKAPAPLEEPATQGLDLAPPCRATYAFRTFHPPAPFKRSPPLWHEQTPTWQRGMQNVGESLRQNRVSHIFLSHGTFVGRDPFDMIELLRGSFPASVKLLNHRFMMQLKDRKEALLKDLGNFTPEYSKLLATAGGPGIEIVRFTWSSGNHHLARVIGALELLSVIAPNVANNQTHRFLLIGHSHAGQLFAILTQMLADEARANSLLAIAARAGFSLPNAPELLTALRHQPLDIVTLGTPPRYDWQLQPHQRLLHIINHRGETPLGGSVRGLLSTRDGDYIQQWGIAGSDSLCPIRLHAELNRELTAFFGIGFNVSYWQHAMKKRQRLPACGHTLLVDYKDNGKSFNCITTIFGHGVYTRYEALLYNMTEITNYFYKSPPLITIDGASS